MYCFYFEKFKIIEKANSCKLCFVIYAFTILYTLQLKIYQTWTAIWMKYQINSKIKRVSYEILNFKNLVKKIESCHYGQIKLCEVKFGYQFNQEILNYLLNTQSSWSNKLVWKNGLKYLPTYQIIKTIYQSCKTMLWVYNHIR